jgi:hypothetical protein
MMPQTPRRSTVNLQIKWREFLHIVWRNRRLCLPQTTRS